MSNKTIKRVSGAVLAGTLTATLGACAKKDNTPITPEEISKKWDDPDPNKCVPLKDGEGNLTLYVNKDGHYKNIFTGENYKINGMDVRSTVPFGSRIFHGGEDGEDDIAYIKGDHFLITPDNLINLDDILHSFNKNYNDESGNIDWASVIADLDENYKYYVDNKYKWSDYYVDTYTDDIFTDKAALKEISEIFHDDINLEYRDKSTAQEGRLVTHTVSGENETGEHFDGRDLMCLYGVNKTIIYNITNGELVIYTWGAPDNNIYIENRSVTKESYQQSFKTGEVVKKCLKDSTKTDVDKARKILAINSEKDNKGKTYYKSVTKAQAH